MPKKNPPPVYAQLPVPVDLIQRRIYLIRGQKVILDADLAELYRVTTGNLNLAVRRNKKRFPRDFMFRLSKKEADGLLLQFARANNGRGGRRSPPYAFTEHGVAMLSSVLNSDRAIQMNILIVRAFLKLREALATHKDFANRIGNLERSQKDHASVINILADEIDQIKRLPEPAKRHFGFKACHR